MIHINWQCIAHHDSQILANRTSSLFKQLAQHNSPWLVAVNHCELCWANGRKSWCAMLSVWLCIMVCYVEPVVVNLGVLCWASSCESWCAIVSQWLWNSVCYGESVVTTTRSAYLTMINTHWLRIAHHDSQTLAQHRWPLFNHCIICWCSDAHHDVHPLAQHSLWIMMWYA
jgi:hypothetical protein